MAHVTEPFFPGADLAVAYRVSPFQRFVAAWASGEREAALRGPSVAASRQTRESTTHTSIDQNVRIRLAELQYPGNYTNVIPATGKWGYIFNKRSRTCIVEGQCQQPPASQSVVALTRQWRYRFGTITPASMGTSAAMPMLATDAIEIQTEPDDQPSDLFTFISPVRLSRSALQHLIDRLGDESLMAPERCVFAPVRWTSTYDGYSWVSDPFAWTADAQSMFYCPATENWVEWTTDSDRSAKIFIARALKAWIDAGITQITNNLNAGQPNAWIREYERTHNRLRDTAFRAGSYLCNCINGADHRAVEQSMCDHGGDQFASVATHWSWVTMGLMSTDPGRRFLMSLCQSTDRFPTRFIFADNPPVSFTSWIADARYAYISVRQLAFNLVPALVEYEMTGLVRQRAEWVAKWQRIRQKVGAKLEAMYRGQMNWRTRAVRNELRAGSAAATASDVADADLPVRAGSSVVPGRRARVAREFEALVASVGESLPREYPAADLARLRSRHEALGAHAEKWTLRLAPITAAAEIFNMCVAIQGVRDAAENEPEASIFGMRARMSTVGFIGASADAAAAIAEFTNVMANRAVAGAAAAGTEASLVTLRTAAASKFIGGPLAMISGTTEMLAHGQAMVDAGWGRGNTAQAIASGTAAVGGALTAISGGLVLAGYFLGASSSLGPVGIVVGIIGAVLILVGAFLAHVFSRDPYEEFAQYSFLGPDGAAEAGWGFDWSPTALPARQLPSQVNVLMHILAAFQIKRSGAGSFSQYATSAPPRIFTEINLSVTGDNPVLDIEVAMKSRGTEFICRMRFRGHAAEMQYYREVNSLVLDPAGSAPTRDAEGRLTGYRLNLRPVWLIRTGQSTVAPDGGWLAALEHVHVRARLNLGGQVHSPRHLDACQFDILDADDGDGTSSLDTSTYVGMAWT